jgi:hypothetical protein
MQRSRFTPWAAAAALVVAVFTALGVPTVARAGVPDSQLLRTYQPVMHFDPLEAFAKATACEFCALAAASAT